MGDMDRAAKETHELQNTVATLDENHLVAPERHLATVTDLEAKVNALVVSDQHSFEMGAEIVGIAKRMLATLEQARKGEVAPLNSQVSAINASYKVVTGRLQPIIKSTDEKMGAYQTRLREAEELARKEAEKARVKAEAAAAKAVAAGKPAPPPPPPAPVIPQAPAMAATSQGGVSMRGTWTFEVKNIDKVPRKYLTIDEAKVKALVKAGEREIPGLRIYEKFGTTLR